VTSFTTTRRRARLACRLSVVVFSLVLTAAGQEKVLLGEEVRTATVRFLIIGVKPAELVSGFRILAFQEDSGKSDLAYRFVNGLRKDKASGIPYGTYWARVYIEGFWGAAQQKVQVSKPDVLVVIDMRPGPPRGSSIPDRIPE
jgi:hypothetical protein